MERGRSALVVVASALGGLAVGILGTVVSQGVLTIAAVQLPWGLVLGLALTVTYLLGLRLSMESRWPVIVGFLAEIAVIAFVAGETKGGSVLIPSNLWGVVWSIAPALVGVVIVAWPRLRRSAPTAAN